MYVYKRVDISMMIMRNASAIKGCCRRTPELSNVALFMKQDTTSIEKKP